MSTAIRSNSPIIMPWTSQPQVPIGTNFDYAFNAFGKVPSALSVKRWVALEIAV